MRQIELAIGSLALWSAIAIAVYGSGVIAGLFRLDDSRPAVCAFALALWASSIHVCRLSNTPRD
jgi:hypothetical protein